jgi:hypothetical protein
LNTQELLNHSASLRKILVMVPWDSLKITTVSTFGKVIGIASLQMIREHALPSHIWNTIVRTNISSPSSFCRASLFKFHRQHRSISAPGRAAFFASGCSYRWHRMQTCCRRSPPRIERGMVTSWIGLARLLDFRSGSRPEEFELSKCLPLFTCRTFGGATW